ncbi:hypothetical protein [Myxococcus sp. RHSTA-1-4]|uniref:hypothetical protein n=1 Tax=Myxococcus sp. RHSTA-1-4 TaxID=2874601 RepID=UPI001CBC4C0E|nr:hypothetical protein [Myxococcus sp. RHSTA-1-4]MBZ4418126.1 hypothetical protein [Myxococcus sp. RHSTA-1-4]
MSVDERTLIARLRSGPPLTAPSPAVLAFAERAGALGPRALVKEAAALSKVKADAPGIARVVAGTLRAMLGDIEEHAANSEFADERPFIRKTLRTWSRQAGDAAEIDEVLLKRGATGALVGAVEYARLPPAEHGAWMALRRSRRLPVAVGKLVKKPLAPWFAELVAAYLAREVEQISSGAHGSSWQANLADVPAMLALLRPLGMPPLFTPRVLRAANIAVVRHGHEPTRRALEAMGALYISQADREAVQRSQRMSEVMKRAAAENRVRQRPVAKKPKPAASAPGKSPVAKKPKSAASAPGKSRRPSAAASRRRPSGTR